MTDWIGYFVVFYFEARQVTIHTCWQQQRTLERATYDEAPIHNACRNDALRLATLCSYAFEGYLYSIFHGQTYSTSFGDVTGDEILQSKQVVRVHAAPRNVMFLSLQETSNRIPRCWLLVAPCVPQSTCFADDSSQFHAMVRSCAVCAKRKKIFWGA